MAAPEEAEEALTLTMRSRRSFLAGSIALTGAGLLPRGRVVAASRVRFSRDPFSLGVASGYPTTDSVVLWTRLAPSPLEPGGGVPSDAIVAVNWEVATDDTMRSVVKSGTAFATAEWAHSVHVEPSGLEPAREYWYRFTSGRARSPVGRFKTAPARGDALAKLRMVIASCQQYEHGYYTAYRHIVSDSPDLIVHVGDYIYELTWGDELVRSHDAPECYTLDDYRARHALYKSDANLAAAHAACPWLVTWDDHEVDNNYGADFTEEDDSPELALARRAAAYQAYYEHMPLPRRSISYGPFMRLYAQRAFGDLASIFMLDQRQYRSRPELLSQDRTMLGHRQESWLYTGLGNSRAQWNIMAQGTVMSFGEERAAVGRNIMSDGWNGYVAGRSRLLRVIDALHVRNPVVVSGDIHAFVVSGLLKDDADPASPVVAPEFVTSSITSQGTPQSYLDARRAANPRTVIATGSQRGYLRLDVTRQTLSADLIAMDTVKKPDSGRTTLASYVVEAGRPQPVPA
jgi:alkaline phosphatase D